MVLIAKMPEGQKNYVEYVENVKELLKGCGLEECERMLANNKKVFIAMWFDDLTKNVRRFAGQ